MSGMGETEKEQTGQSNIPLALADRIASRVSRQLAPSIVTAAQVRRVFRHGDDSIDDPRIGEAIEGELQKYWLRPRLGSAHLDRAAAKRMPSAEHEPVFTIKAKDNLALDTIAAYHALCAEHGLDHQAGEVSKALSEIRDWRAEHPDRWQMPDHDHVPVSARDERDRREAMEVEHEGCHREWRRRESELHRALEAALRERDEARLDAAVRHLECRAVLEEDVQRAEAEVERLREALKAIEINGDRMGHIQGAADDAADIAHTALSPREDA